MGSNKDIRVMMDNADLHDVSQDTQERNQSLEHKRDTAAQRIFKIYEQNNAA